MHKSQQPHSHIEISLRNVNQLFNSMDPSPFHEKDLDHDAEEFLVGWAREHPRNLPLELILHVRESPPPSQTEATIQDAVRNYFLYRARVSDMNLKELLRQGRTSLFVGLGFLTACLLMSDYLATHAHSTLAGIIQESLSIGGWVAMWRPLQIYLYDWWPIRSRGRLFERMSRMDVILQQTAT